MARFWKYIRKLLGATDSARNPDARLADAPSAAVELEKQTAGLPLPSRKKGPAKLSQQPFRPVPSYSAGEKAEFERRVKELHLLRPPRVTVLVWPGIKGADCRRTWSSLQEQVYSNWEVIAADDLGAAHPRLMVTDEAGDPARPRGHSQQRVVVVEPGRSLADWYLRALKSARGEWITWVHPGDSLRPDALLLLAEHVVQDRSTDVIYSDEAQLNEQGEMGDCRFKPCWSPELSLAQHYVGSLVAYRRHLLGTIRMSPRENVLALEHEIFLHVSERTNRIVHIQEPLYLRRSWHDYASQGDWQGTSAESVRVICETLDRRGLKGEVTPSPAPGVLFVRVNPQRKEKVSIIIPTRDRADFLAPCVKSILDATHDVPFEILIADNDSRETATRELFESWENDPRIRVIPVPGEFNYSRINNIAARQSHGELLLLLNNDTKVLRKDWLAAMVGLTQLPGVAACGGKLYFHDDTIQHAGLILRGGGKGLKPAMSAHKLFRRDAPGYCGSLFTIRNFSAVTAACLLVRRDSYFEVDGLDEELAVAYNDVDFCLKLRRAGYRIAWTPLAELYHYESISRGADNAGNPRWEAEKARMHQKWGKALHNDPYYNPNLTLDGTNFEQRPRAA